MLETVLISGGTKGLGRALSLSFAQAGFHVVATYRSDLDGAQGLHEAFISGGLDPRRLTCLQHDVRTPLPPVPAIQDADALILIHNACASFQPKPMHLCTTEDLQTQWEVAVLGGWMLSQAVIRRMVRNKRGTIVNILSEVVEGPAPKGFSVYTCAKYGLLGLTRSLAAEYNPRGIRVFAVSPGFMETTLTADWDATLKRALAPADSTAVSPDAVASFVHSLCTRPSAPDFGEGENYRVQRS